jgi:hypothetical protein
MMLTVDDVITTCMRFPARALRADPMVLASAADLSKRLNKLFVAFGHSRKLTSGFRDPASNARVGGAKHSAHIEGKAADVEDGDGRLAIYCLRNEPLLATLGLWMEDPLHTKGWVHLQSRPVPGVRVFKP